MNIKRKEEGFTIIDLVVGMTLMGVFAVGILGLFVSLVNSSIASKQMSVGLSLATNQMEYLRSLPYDDLAVAGGSIYSPNPIPASKTENVDGVTYTINTSISYVDEAYDGCADYPTQELKETYCRNYPEPSGAPAIDTNPQDYKIAHVEVYNPGNIKRAEVDSQVSSRVSETNSTTGALFVSVVDDNGNPVSGANVQVTNTTVSPSVNLSDSSDSNGTAIFYGLSPDTSGYDYRISVSKTGYSSLFTIKPSGSLQPNYSGQNILTQQSSYLTMVIKPQGEDSLLAEAVDTSGSPVAGLRLYTKGGYKKYTSSTDTEYYFDNLTPTDTRPTTDSSGFATYTDLVPGEYIFCGDAGATSCSSGSTTYYLAAAVPYSGGNSLSPINVPIYSTTEPPSTTFPYSGGSYLQKVQLIFSTNSSFPRIRSLSPYEVSLSSTPLSSFTFQIDGANLPCSSTASSCGTTVELTQDSNTYTASCTGTTGDQLSCTVDISGISTGTAQLRITANGNTLTLPGSPLLGGLIVSS